MSDTGSRDENNREIATAESPAKPIPLARVARAPDMACQFVTQQGAIAFKCAVDHLCVVMREGEEALKKILTMIVEDPAKAPFYEQAIKDVQTAIADAADNLAKVGENAGKGCKLSASADHHAAPVMAGRWVRRPAI